VQEATGKALDLIGGMSSIIAPKSLVVLKPNFVAPIASSAGVTTSLDLVEELIEEILALGSKPVIVESSGIEYNTGQVFDVLGLGRLAQKYGVEVLDAENLETTEVKLDNGMMFDALSLPKIVLEADNLISIPKMKTHVLTTVSLGLKNLMGLLRPEDRRKMHFHGIDRGLLDLYCVLKDKTACVVDGLVAMEGNAAVYGEKLDLGIVVAGTNLVATDRLCCRIMGIDPCSVRHLANASDRDDLTVVLGENIDEVAISFRKPSVGRFYRFSYGRLLFGIDQTLSTLTHRRSFLPYILGHFGTRPEIVESRCNRCMDCATSCPVEAIDLKVRIDRDRCIRCLRCYEVCSKNAIAVRGFTKPGKR
jgi:uncharacterized protein (DUF362 family)/Pyruvate/2-oxoacid:ferredoxin oxidoreductase delta subunit